MPRFIPRYFGDVSPSVDALNLVFSVIWVVVCIALAFP